MTRFLLSILPLFIFQFSLFAFNGEKRLSKNNIISIQSNQDASLLLNDKSGNVFIYDGNQIKQIEFTNDIDFPSQILSNLKNKLLYTSANTVFLKEKDGSLKEILSVPKFENIIKAVENQDFYFISSSNALYEIEKSTGVVIELYKNNIEKTDHIICGTTDCYLALKNIVINLSKKDIVEVSLQNRISSIAYHKQFGILLLSEDEVYIQGNDGSRKLFPTMGSMPTGMTSICGNNRWLFLITDHSVSVFDWVNSEMKNLGGFNGFPLSTHVDQWDNLWLATNQGLWNFSPSKRFDSPKITGIEVTDKDNIAVNKFPLRFTKTNSLVNITPNIVYLPNTESIVTEWRIEDEAWRPFAKDFALSETMLPDGKSSVYIRSKSDKADYSLPYKIQVENSINSTKIPSIWYAALGLIGALLVVSFISLFNLRSKENESKSQIEKLKAENALLQTKQQIDQLQMNPHFIFNALNSINGLIATGEISESRKAISLFAKFLRQFLYQSQGDDILIEEELDLIKNYVKIEQVCRSNSFSFKTEIKDNSLLDVKIPNMIIQPFIENAIIHAFTEKKEGEIKLIIQEEEDYIVAVIIDNGVGIKNATVKNKDHKSVAIDLVKKRLAQRDKNRRKNYLQYLDNNPGTIAKIYLKRL